MKILKKSSKPKPKQQRLTVPDIIHWAYLHLNAQNGRFKEDSRLTSVKFHTDHSTITRRHQRLCKLGCITADERTVAVRDNKTGRMLPVTYFVPSPPAKYLQLAHLVWDIENEVGVRPPVANVHTAEPIVNSGSDPCAPMQHISADVSNDALLTVNSSTSSNTEIVNSDVSVASAHTEKDVESKWSSPCASTHTAQLDRTLRDLENKLARYREWNIARPDLEQQIAEARHKMQAEAQ